MAPQKVKKKKSPISKLKVTDILKKIYYNPENPAAFSSVENVFREAHRLNNEITRKDVRQQLERSTTYTLHKPRRVKYPRLKTVPRGYLTDMQADLADFQKTASSNNGYRYILVCVDVLSRKLYTAPVRTKSPVDMIPAFDIIFEQMPCTPRRLFTDKGLEFQAREMRRYFENNGILKYVAQSPDVKAAIAERYIQTLKIRLYKYFTATKSERWLDIVPKLVRLINRSRNRITNMRPNEVTKDNADELWNRMYLTKIKEGKKFKVGDFVRIDREKGAFHKGYLPNYTQEIFRVRRVKAGNQPYYHLEDLTGEEILGKFYDYNLSKYDFDPKKFDIIEKFYKLRYNKTGELEYLVTFKQNPKQFYWINNAYILD